MDGDTEEPAGKARGSVNLKGGLCGVIDVTEELDMNYLTLDLIKQQCRIEADFTMEDELLEMYGESAEQAVEANLGRSYDELVETYETVPAPVVQVALMIAAASYHQREAYTAQNLETVPIWVMMLKPYVRLASTEE